MLNLSLCVWERIKDKQICKSPDQHRIYILRQRRSTLFFYKTGAPHIPKIQFFYPTSSLFRLPSLSWALRNDRQSNIKSTYTKRLTNAKEMCSTLRHTWLWGNLSFLIFGGWTISFPLSHKLAVPPMLTTHKDNIHEEIQAKTKVWHTHTHCLYEFFRM